MQLRSRSSGNARVLAYLVETWDANVASGADKSEITVEQLIAEKCQKIFADLHVAGWPEQDVHEFFAAISLLPPPIPLNELATALGWQISQVMSAASDLAPMLEIVVHGAIFRDEPTETYVRDTYSQETDSQQAIAQRLQDAQVSSQYAAEALPSFLVAIKDSNRAYALADSTQFPSVIQSDFGRRRLTLARLNAAFKLAVKDDDLDRVLGVTMRLAQVAAANSRGDEFIRRSPALAVTLGDRDAYRRLFSDRSGWRGARDARLTVAHAFSNEMLEAEIHSSRAIDWINWNVRRERDERELPHERRGPNHKDFASVIFLKILQKDFKAVDQNLHRWNRGLSVPVARESIKLARQYECATGVSVLASLASFAATSKSKSFVLKAILLGSETALTSNERKSLSRSLIEAKLKAENVVTLRENGGGDFVYAAFASLVHDGPASAKRILKHETQIRPSSHDYGERHGLTRAWLPVLHACIAAWSQKRAVAIHDLLPRGVKITRVAKALKTGKDLKAFLAALPAPRRKGERRKKGNTKPESQFDSRECQEIARGIETVLGVIKPIQMKMRAQGSSKGLGAFLANWKSQVPKSALRGFEDPDQLLCRVIGLGFAELLLQHAPKITDSNAVEVIDLVSRPRFRLSERTRVLALLAGRSNLHSRAGTFAHSIASGIRKDDYTEQRGDDYAALADALLEMSVAEAREYYRNGLSELDKLGSGDHDLIYAVLNFAAAQRGGPIRPDLAHRLMNLSQTICTYDSHKFGWVLFGKACARSVGTAAATKLIRWNDQDLAEFSLGLPQLACFLSTEKLLSPLRATALLSLCKDHGWNEWSFGDGLSTILAQVDNIDEQRTIFESVFKKLIAEHANGGWSSVWQGISTVAAAFPGVVSETNATEANKLLAETERKRHEFNSSSSHGEPSAGIASKTTEEADTDKFISALVAKCDPASAASIDNSLKEIEAAQSLPYFATRKFFESIREACPYSKRLDHLLALAEAVNVPIEDAIDRIQECVSAWASSSTHVVAEIKKVISHLFKSKGSGLFNIRYGSVVREMSQLTELCNDAGFVLRRVLGTIASERVELDGEQWLQLATSLSKQASKNASREALENFLSGPAAGLADEIGEGPYQSVFNIEDERALVVGIIWHLLGDDDAYIKWSAARALSVFAELGLTEELDDLLAQFDRKEVPALTTKDHYLSFQNSQQWLLMGLARAALIHGIKLAPLKHRLLSLAARKDLHILHKRQILRCLKNIGSTPGEIASLENEVAIDPKGVVVSGGWPKHTSPKSDFSFDYEFNKTEVPHLARVFRISDGPCADAITHEIQRLWPQATNMDAFPGINRYRRDRTDRYEYYRDHVQKHGMLSAATTLRNSIPVARESYDHDPVSPFARWLNDYDVTANDGSWLSDHKDEEPDNAGVSLLGPRVKGRESILAAPGLFERLGLLNAVPGAMLPIHGHWRSPDGVYIRIESALGVRRGIVGLCEKFSKRSDHDLWVPTFNHDGVDDPHRQASPFEPFVWVLENYGLGVDAGEKIATSGVASRARLGVELQKTLGLIPDNEFREWKTADNKLALRSQVWGEWLPDPDSNNGHHRNESAEILWASPGWLDQVLPSLDRQLVYTVTLNKYKERYDNGSGTKAVYVATRPAGKNIRFWYAKKSSATTY